MSYDLIVRGDGDRAVAVAEIRALPDAQRFEVTPADGAKAEGSLAVVCMNGDDEACAQFARALWVWTKQRGHALFDPQRGKPVSSVTQLPWPAPAGRGKALEARFAHLLRSELAAFGFSLRGRKMVARDLGPIEQGLELVSLSGGRFTITVWWRVVVGAEPGSAGYTGATRIDRLRGDGKDYLVAKLEQSFARMRADVMDHALPHLERYRSPASLLRATASGELAMHDAFGADEGWQLFHRAMCLAHDGRTDEAVADLQRLIDEHSEPHHLRHARRMRAEGQEEFALQAEELHAKDIAAGRRGWIEARGDRAKRHLDALRATGRLAPE